MQVVHLELPRELSFTVRPWRGELSAALQPNGFRYRQADLNLAFWRWVLDDPATDRVGRLLDLRHQGGAFNARLIDDCARRAESLPVPMGALRLQGLALAAEVADSTRGVLDWGRSDDVQAFWLPWLRLTHKHWADADLLSLSVGSAEELALAGVLAEHVRRIAPQIHVCLAHHRWENFSLAPRLQGLVSEGVLLEIVDSVVLREDRAGHALVGLCKALRDGDLAALDSVAVRQDGVPRFVGPAQGGTPVGADDDDALAAYIGSLEAPVGRILMLEALVRNDCHYGKCTFCVQNIGYPERQQYKYRTELDRSVSLIRRLVRHGVRNFSFIDQALHPRLLEAFCDRLSDDPPAMRWCIRMLPETALELSAELLRRLADLGCSDILLGLESVDPRTLAAMGKSHEFHGERAHRWLARCADLGLDVTLSAMRAFPTESDEAFEQGTAAFLAACAQRHDNIAVILNRFVLFQGSALAAAPADHGLREVLPPVGDLASALAYTDEHGRVAEAGPPPAPAAYVHYSSIGLLYRWETGRWLTADLAREEPERWLQPERDTLVLGGNGYLGRALAARLPADRLVLSGRRPANSTTVDAPYIAQDLCLGRARLERLAPHTVWLCARPSDDDLEVQLDFLREVQALLHAWAERGTLRRLVVFSTQLVADTPTDGTRVSGRSPLAPQAPYDLAKAQLELFAGYMARRWPLSVDVVRLALLYGAEERADDLPMQLIPSWRRALQSGARWRFEAGDERFGNSWVDVGDLVGALERDAGPGLRVRAASSGDFTYAELQQAWAGGTPSGELLHLPRSRFFLEDELGLPTRALPSR